jgi:SpoVK/Ycf46/Vps4 family AAA+-type ATPase
LESVIKFLNSKELSQIEIFNNLKCSKEEAKILQFMLKLYVKGNDTNIVIDILNDLYSDESYTHISKVSLIKNLLQLGWIIQSGFGHIKISQLSGLELLNASISLSTSFLKLVEEGNLEFILPEVKEYSDHLEYLQDQFLKIDLVQKINNIKSSTDENSPSSNRLKSKLTLLENRIQERIQKTDNEIVLEIFFKENRLEAKEKTIFLALLKEEYSGDDESVRDMNSLINLISSDDYERIKNRSLLEENSNLISQNLIDYDEMLMPFGGIHRNFFIPDEVLYKISHPSKKKVSKVKTKLDTALKDQELFELISTNKTLDDVVLNPPTRDTLELLLKQVDKNVIKRLKEWGIKDKKRGIDARIIFYGLAGTGKTITALALAKSLKKQVLSFDCSKILSMYVGESEKNVRNIFDTYKEIAQKTKSEPILLLNEADQFLSSRTSGVDSGSEKMHNQMQNIFLEQIERFDGILIATTNLLENIDKAFSRRFNYKIEFTKPDFDQRIKLWQKLLPDNLPLEDELEFNKLAKANITGGQIEMIIKNTAYEVAISDDPLFSTKVFISQIEKEQNSQFDKEKIMGFNR